MRRKLLAGAKPSDGLEPSTPSLPCAPPVSPLIAADRDVPADGAFRVWAFRNRSPVFASAGFQSVSKAFNLIMTGLEQSACLRRVLEEAWR